MFGKGQVETDAFLRTLGWHEIAQQEYDTKLSADHEEVPAGLRRRGQRLPQGPRRQGTSPSSTRRWTSERLQAREVDPGRLGRLAQGDGLGPARQHAGRDRPLPDDQPAQPEADRGALPGLPVRPQQADRRRAAAVDRGHREFDPKGAATTDTARRHRGRPRGRRRRPADASSPRSPTPSTRSRRCSARTAAASAPTPGSSPASYTTTGKPLLANDPHLAPQLPSRLVPDGPALPHGLAAPARTTSPATPSPGCPAWSSATTRTSPGA